ncbi:PREDICTED: uncharacterized protein C1orf167-like [Chrysochloris asiatica]|uniref:Uncharacterized protein C1orf167-like n=1 Tax=Chrysochloris asiatica TaxID=185453 RepID=A0A9B0WTB5_CHRAS|nr:PREDICTED: uncharacterized protein C1orf167-like [Chrysochloris asiatica]
MNQRPHLSAKATALDRRHHYPGSGPEHMELRQDASFKENVPPKPSAPLRPESQRSLKSLGSGHGQQVPVHQARRGGPAFTPSIGAMLHREPCPIQTNLARPGLSPGLTLGDKTGQRKRVNSSFLQQSNLQPWAGRPHRRTWSFAFQQSNLSLNKVSLASYGNHSSPCFWPEPQGSFDPHTLPRGNHLYQSGQLTCPSLSLRQSRPPAPNTPCPDFIPQDGYPRPGLSSWRALGRWASGAVGEPLTLEDLTVPAQSQARTLSRADIHQLLASVRHLELEADRFSCCTSQELLVAPAYPQPSQPEKQSWQLLPRCFKAWRHLVQRGWAVAAVEALYHRQLLKKVLRTLRWTLYLREARLNAAWGRHIKALLAQSFREVRGLQVRLGGKWRKLAARLKQERSHVQGAPGHPSSGTGWDLGPSGREAAVYSTRSSRCFGVWHQFVQREAHCRDHLADRRVRTLNTCLQQWVQMKQLRVLDGMKVTQLSLCRQKTALPGPAPGAAAAQDPGAVAQAQGPLLGRGRGSLQEACRKLALQRALQLWRMQLSQCQQAK